MLSRQPHPLGRHASPHGHDIQVALAQPRLEVAVAPVARQLVAGPVGREEARGAAGGRVVGREARVVGAEVVEDEGFLGFLRGQGAEGGGEVVGLVAVGVEEEGWGGGGGGGEGAELDDLGEPAGRVGGLRVVGREPLAEAADGAAGGWGWGEPEGGGEGDVDLGGSGLVSRGGGWVGG
jgi:hypothetical protein